MNNREKLEVLANDIRKDIVKMTYLSGVKGAHLGGSLSMAEILAVLYGQILKYDVTKPEWPERDRVIISKAHAAVGLYAALHYANYLSTEEIEGAMHGESPFFEHPKKNIEKGIEFSGGSLGQGLSLGMGTALGLKMRGNHSAHVYVILGDGECNEGQVWEAAAAVGHYQLDNVTVIVDANGLQYDGKNCDIMKNGDFGKRWESLGFTVLEVDGHDVMALENAMSTKSAKPVVLIANTIKGKGVSFAENVVEWHTGRLTDELYETAMEELMR